MNVLNVCSSLPSMISLKKICCSRQTECVVVVLICTGTVFLTFLAKSLKTGGFVSVADVDGNWSAKLLNSLISGEGFSGVAGCLPSMTSQWAKINISKGRILNKPLNFGARGILGNEAWSRGCNSTSRSSRVSDSLISVPIKRRLRWEPESKPKGG